MGRKALWKEGGKVVATRASEVLTPPGARHVRQPIRNENYIIYVKGDLKLVNFLYQDLGMYALARHESSGVTQTSIFGALK